MPKQRRFDPDAVEAFIRRSCGVVRVKDLVSLGMNRQTISHRCRPRGPWQRILRGIVLALSGMPSVVQKVMAGLLFAGTGSVLTGVAALRFHGFHHLPPDWTVHVLIPHRRRRMPASYVLLERTRRLPPHSWINGIPCAPVARAVIDATRRMNDFDTVRAVIAEAVQRGFCGLHELLAELAEAQTWGSKLPRKALREVMAGVRSVAEAKARACVRKAKLPQPLWNHDVYDKNGRWLARPDCIWPELGVVLEIDSRTWHLSPASWRRTQARQRRMSKYGLLVIPVSPADLLENTAAVLSELAETLANAALRPAPVVVVKPATMGAAAA